MNANAVKIFLMTGPPFGLAMGAITEFLYSFLLGNASVFWGTAILSGSAAGILFTIFSQSKMVAKSVAIEVPEGETVMYDDGANHFLGQESRGGHLYLTDHHLIFQPHDFNIQLQSVKMPLSAISKVTPRQTFYLVPNGLAVETKDGEVHKFVVFNRKRWLAEIASVMAAI
jgi:GRAM domain